jgi:hypothetical protein
MTNVHFGSLEIKEEARFLGGLMEDRDLGLHSPWTEVSPDHTPPLQFLCRNLGEGVAIPRL